MFLKIRSQTNYWYIIFFACKLSQRFAADQAMQLLQSIALESSDGEYSDSKSNELNNVIADIQNEKDSSTSDDEYTDQEVQVNTDNGARA